MDGSVFVAFPARPQIFRHTPTPWSAQRGIPTAAFPFSLLERALLGHLFFRPGYRDGCDPPDSANPMVRSWFFERRSRFLGRYCLHSGNGRPVVKKYRGTSDEVRSLCPVTCRRLRRFSGVTMFEVPWPVRGAEIQSDRPNVGSESTKGALSARRLFAM